MAERLATQQRNALAAYTEACTRGFAWFLFNQVWIRDVQADGSSRTIKWEHWPVHDEWLELDKNSRCIVCKARQLGWSWFRAAKKVYRMITEDDYLGAVISAGETESAEFLAKCRFIWEHLPYSLPLVTDNTQVLKCRDTNGAIMAFPSTEKAGRGFTFNDVDIDEAAFHPFAQENQKAWEAAAEHGQVAVASSAGGDADGKQVVNDWFERTYNAAPDNGFVAQFYGWDRRPARNAEWYLEREKRLGHYAAMKEYPSTVEEAFQSMLNPRFDLEGLDYIKERVRDHRTSVTLPEGITPAYLKVWETPRPNTPYISYTDSAAGVGRDYTVTTIAEARTLKVVCRFREHVLEPEVHGAKARLLATWYNMAYVSWERDKGEGIAMAFAGYSRIHYHEAEQTLQQKRMGLEGQKRPGIPVTESTRTDLISGLALAIESGQLDDPDNDAYEELRYFVKVEHRLADGRVRYRDQAAAGKHDDIVLCLCGIVALSKVPAASRMRTTGVALEVVEMKYGF